MFNHESDDELENIKCGGEGHKAPILSEHSAKHRDFDVKNTPLTHPLFQKTF